VDTIYKIGIVVIATGAIVLMASFVPLALFILVTLVLITAAIIGGFIGYFRLRIQRQAIKAGDQANAMRDADIAHRKQETAIAAMFAQAQLNQVQAGATFASGVNGVTIEQFRKPVDILPRIEAVTERKPLMETLANANSILVVGGAGSGKTTLLQHIEMNRLQAGQTLVFDSHAQPSKWAGHTIGNGRGYANIIVGMVALLAEMDKRYKRFSTGDNDFPQVTNFIDEFTNLPPALKRLDYNIQDFSIPILTESRKVNLHSVWGIHSSKSKAMGLAGSMDLMESFSAIVYLKNVSGQRHSLVNFGDGIDKTMEYQLPGIFVVNPPQQSVLTLPVGVPVVATGDVSNGELVLRLHAEGASKNRICKEVYGYKNARTLREIDAILDGDNGGAIEGDADGDSTGDIHE